MSWPEQLPAFCDALVDEARHLDAVREALAARRQGFVAARPSALAATTADLEPLAAAARAAAGRRAEAAEAVTRALGLPADARSSTIVARLAPSDAERLAAAVRTARRAAERLRVENAVGGELLAASQRIQEDVWRRVAETATPAAAETYDARSCVHDRRDVRGRLVDGHA